MTANTDQNQLEVSLVTLGQRDSLELAGAPASSTMTLAVPAGLHAANLTGTIDVAADTSAGILEVYDAGRRLGAINLLGRAGRTLALDVAVDSATVIDRAITVTFALASTDGTCRPNTARPTTVRDLTLTYSGTETAPSTVANFLPPVLNQLDLYVPTNPSADVKAATLTLASSVAARYAPATPRIAVRTLTGETAVAPIGPFTRAVVLTGTGAPAIRLATQTRVLTISGVGTELNAQIDALQGDLASIAQTSRATVSRVQSRPELSPSTQTLSDVGLGQVSATGGGSATVTLGVDAAALGPPASSWTTHLVGTVTTGAEPSASMSRGTLTLTSNGTPVASWAIPENGRFDVRPTIRGASLGRYVSLALTATANGSGDCATLPRVDLSIDSASTLTAVREPVAPFSGFADLPAVLRPSYQMATTGQSVADLGDAVSFAVSVQRQVQVSLDPQLVDVETLMASTVPAVLLAGTTVPDGLVLPLAATNAQVNLKDGSVLSGDTALATFQVSATNGRYLAVVSGTRPGLVRGLTDWLADSRKLGSLSGDVAVYAASGDVQTLALNVEAPAPVRNDATTTGYSAGAIGIAGLAGVLILLAGLALGLTADRRRTSRRANP